MNHDAYRALLQNVDDVIRMLEGHPDERTREQVLALLGGLDALHREALGRLVGRLREFGGEALVERLADDPVVHTLLGLYDFVELDVPEEEPQPAGAAGFVPVEEVGFGRTHRPDRDSDSDTAGSGREGAPPPASVDPEGTP